MTVGQRLWNPVSRSPQTFFSDPAALILPPDGHTSSSHDGAPRTPDPTTYVQIDPSTSSHPFTYRSGTGLCKSQEKRLCAHETHKSTMHLHPECERSQREHLTNSRPWVDLDGSVKNDTRSRRPFALEWKEPLSHSPGRCRSTRVNVATIVEDPTSRLTRSQGNTGEHPLG